MWTLALTLTGSVGLAHAIAPAAASPASASANAKRARQPAVKLAAPVDINTASRKDLKTLPGVGDVEVDRIVSGRPYHSTADLAERDVIPTGVYVSLKGRIIATQKANGKVGVP